jgi:hypothetical protein
MPGMQVPSTQQIVQLFIGVLLGLGIGFGIHGNLPAISATVLSVLHGKF